MDNFNSAEEFSSAPFFVGEGFNPPLHFDVHRIKGGQDALPYKKAGFHGLSFVTCCIDMTLLFAFSLSKLTI